MISVLQFVIRERKAIFMQAILDIEKGVEINNLPFSLRLERKQGMVYLTVLSSSEPSFERY